MHIELKPRRVCAAQVTDSILFDSIREHQDMIGHIAGLSQAVNAAAIRMSLCLKRGGKLLWCGNGGSAADAQHLAAELIGRFKLERRGLASVALTTDTSILTGVGNDYGFDKIYGRQLEALCRPGDVLVGISTSGKSRNVVEAITVARSIGAFTIALSGGNGGDLSKTADLCLCVPSRTTARIQEAHILIGHVLCEIVEQLICCEL